MSRLSGFYCISLLESIKPIQNGFLMIFFRVCFGPDFRGHKPIQICLANYKDKEEILRKARLLKGSNIYSKNLRFFISTEKMIVKALQ